MKLHPDDLLQSGGVSILERIRASPPEPHAFKKALGDRIGALRKKRFDTIEAFAQSSGLNPAYVWRIEAGRQNLGLATLCRVSHALQVDLVDLFIDLEVSALRIQSLDRQNVRHRHIL